MTDLEKEYKFKYSDDINEAARDCQECLYDGYYSGHIECYQQAFKEGAEWKEQQMIDKVCEWLKENAYLYVNDYTGSLNEDMLIEDFKNYMKGELYDTIH